jgi:hypothetical protein
MQCEISVALMSRNRPPRPVTGIALPLIALLRSTISVLLVAVLLNTFSILSHVRGYAWWIITGSGSDDWIYWCCFTITLSYSQYSTITDLRNLQFTVAHTLGLSVSTSCILATDVHTGTIISNHYEVLSFLLQSPWTADYPELDPILQFQSPWFLTLCSSVLISHLISVTHGVPSTTLTI